LAQSVVILHHRHNCRIAALVPRKNGQSSQGSVAIIYHTFWRKSAAMVRVRSEAKSPKGALMQTPWVCVRQRRCLCTLPWGYAPPRNPPPKACRLWTPALGFSHPKTLDKGRACPLNLPGGVPSPSTPDQPSAGWMRASAVPLWTGTQGALLPESPAPEISLPGTLAKGRACPLNLPGGVPSPSTPEQPFADCMRASALPRWTGTQGARLPENPGREGSRSRAIDGRTDDQPRAAILCRRASPRVAAQPRYLAPPCLP
jgi:hypothetical protein